MISSSRILVCGASGLLGRELSKILKQNNIEYIGTYNKNKIENAIKVDFFNLKSIENALLENNINVCVNCICEREVDKCDKDWEYVKKINVDITNNIAKVCAKNDIYLIHISTDYVFDGKGGKQFYPYSNVNPLQNYGITKLLSEYKVSNNCKKYSIIRVPVLYTDNITSLEENAVTLISKKVLNRIDREQKEDNYSIRRPNWILDFCYFILDIINLKPNNLNIFINEPNMGINIYHFCNPHDKVTKYEMSNIMCNYLNKKQIIQPVDSAVGDAERPYDTHLKDHKYDIYKYKFTPLKEGIERCLSKLYHPPLYTNKPDNASDLFIVMDLDGTLTDTDKLHYLSYCNAFKKYGIYDALNNYDEFLELVEYNKLDEYCISKGIHEIDFYEFKKCKNAFMKQINNNEHTEVNLIKNAELLIDYIDKNNINHAVVTNTSLENVEFYKSILPPLNKIKNWITRENYVNAKPYPDSYLLAKEKYYNGEKYIIGFENTLVGVAALESITSCIYGITDKGKFNYNKMKKKDIYLINDYIELFVE